MRQADVLIVADINLSGFDEVVFNKETNTVSVTLSTTATVINNGNAPDPVTLFDQVSRLKIREYRFKLLRR